MLFMLIKFSRKKRKIVLITSLTILLSYLMKFYVLKWNTFQKYDFFLKKLLIKVRSRPKFMPVFVFYLWRPLWQTCRTAANFLHNSSLSRNTRFFISGQVLNQSLWKEVQMENTCFKTLKLQNFCKMSGEWCETGAPLSRHFRNFFPVSK